MKSRTPLTIGALAAIIIGVLVALGAFRTSVPAASPSPSPSTITQASSAPSTAPFGLDARYGIVHRAGQGQAGWELVVRTETETRPIGSLGFFQETRMVVSPNGRGIAVWTNRISLERNRLVLWNAATPDVTATLMTSPEGEVGTGIVWAPDSDGLLLSFDSLAVHNPSGEPQIGLPAEETVLRTLDIGTKALTEVARTKLTSLVPVAWDRAGGIIAAYEHGPEAPYAETYVVIKNGQVSRTVLGTVVRLPNGGQRIENVIVDIVSSPDASRVVGSVGPLPHYSTTHLVTWPLAEPGRVTELRPSGERTLVHYGWLPGTMRVVVADLPGGYQGRGAVPLFLWDVVTGARVAIPDGSTWGGAVPRPDGSALYVKGADEATSVLNIVTGERKPILGMPTYSGAAGEPRPQGVALGVLLPPIQAAPSPASPSATAAPGLCSNPRMTTQAVIERYFELSTSKDPRAVSDCFAAPYREHFVRNPTWDEVITMWASAGPASGIQIMRVGDVVRGCDRYSVAVKMPNQSVAPFFTVGLESGTPRIFELGTALVNDQAATTTCK